jgi:hypothetical protein
VDGFDVEISLQLLHIIFSKNTQKFTEIWKDLAGCLLKYLNHENSVIRESAVYCLVDVCNSSNERSSFLTNNLTTSQLKLVNFYLRKH